MFNDLMVSFILLLSRAPLIYLAGVAFTASSFAWMKGLINEYRYKSEWPYIIVILINGMIPTLMSVSGRSFLASLNPATIMVITPTLVILEFALLSRDNVRTYIFFIGMIMLQFTCFFAIGAAIITSVDIPEVSTGDLLVRSSALTFSMFLLSLSVGIFAFLTRNLTNTLKLIFHDWSVSNILFLYMVLNGIVLGVVTGLDYNIYFTDASVNPLRYSTLNGMILRYILILVTSYALMYVQCRREMNREKAVEFEIAANTDPLTGLLNRTGQQKTTENYIHNNNIENKAGVLFLLDLDNFKKINDNLGHPEGDKLLIDVSKKLKSLFRDGDYVCRLGGDEFSVFLTGEASDSLICSKANMINAALKYSYQLEDGQEIKTSASIGIASYPKDGKDYETLYKNADTALYHSKEMGRDRYTIFGS